MKDTRTRTEFGEPRCSEDGIWFVPALLLTLLTLFLLSRGTTGSRVGAGERWGHGVWPSGRAACRWGFSGVATDGNQARAKKNQKTPR